MAEIRDPYQQAEFIAADSGDKISLSQALANRRSNRF